MKRLLSIFFAIFLASSVAFAGSQQTSSTTATALIADARAYLNESSTATHRFFDDTQLLQWLNDGMIDIAARSSCMEATESVDLVAGTIEYALSTAYVTVDSVLYTDGDGVAKGLLEGNVRSIGNVENVGEPVYWYEFAGKIGAYPPLTTKTTETLTVYLVTRPTAIIASASVTTPAVYDKALTLYIVAQGFLKDMRFQSYAAMMTMYLSEIDQYRGEFNEFAREKAEEPIR